MRLLRIVPDNTHFDFIRFRRISFPISAVLSILAITLYFTHGLNFGIDFKRGTLMEVRAKYGAADIESMRGKLNSLEADQPMADVENLLATLDEAWKEIAANDTPAAVAATVPSTSPWMTSDVPVYSRAGYTL